MKPRAAVPLCAFLLAACAVQHVSPEDPKSRLPDRSAAIAPDRTDRAEVRRILGAPVLSSGYWGFDLFLDRTEQAQTVFALTPWPVPFARLKDQLQRYTLVAYSADARATAVTTGLFRKPARWRNTSPIAMDFPSLHLRAGELMFFVDPEGAREANLLAAPARRDAYLQDARTSTRCTVVLACGERGCADRLSVDGGPVRRLPLRTAHGYWIAGDARPPWLDGVQPHGSDPRLPWLDVLVAIKLAAGEHKLSFSAAHLGGETSWSFGCRAGDVIYAVIGAKDNESFWRPALVDWRIERSDALPQPWAQRALVLVDDGQWYVDVEPGE